MGANYFAGYSQIIKCTFTCYTYSHRNVHFGMNTDLIYLTGLASFCVIFVRKYRFPSIYHTQWHGLYCANCEADTTNRMGVRMMPTPTTEQQAKHIKSLVYSPNYLSPSSEMFARLSLCTYLAWHILFIVALADSARGPYIYVHEKYKHFKLIASNLKFIKPNKMFDDDVTVRNNAN